MNLFRKVHFLGTKNPYARGEIPYARGEIPYARGDLPQRHPT